MNTRLRLFFLTLIIITLVISGGVALDQNHFTVASDQPSTDINLGEDSSQGVVVNIYYASQEQLNAIAGELDIWEVHPLPDIGPSAGYAVAAVFPAQKDWLDVLGYRVELNPEKTAMLQAPATALDPRYYYFDSFFTNPNGLYMVNFLQNTNSTYPLLTELLDIGNAWLADHGGYHRDMWVLRITNEDPAYGEISSKPTFFMFANIHAREVTTPEMAIRYIKYLTSGYAGLGGYGIDPDVTWLVNHHVTYVLVSQNPDGRVINEQDSSAWWRKNVDNDDGCGDPSSWGVDLNRNSSFKWGCCGGSSGNPCAETYRGPARTSEPETAAFQTFASTIFQDWNGDNGDDEMVISPDDASGIFLTLHTYADDILWPWGFAPGTAPNDAQLRTIGRKLADITGVMNPTGGIGYTVDGSSDDWVYGKLGVAAFTYEIGPDYGTCGSFFPAYECQDGIGGAPRNFWSEMRQSFIYMNKIAATPYITAYGPDTQSLSITPSVPVGVPAVLTGTVLDNRYSTDPLQPIAGAEYFVDAPGEDGTGAALSPSDGAWGETNEPISGNVETGGLTPGQHYVLVHGMNDDGVWGPFTAIFIDLTAPDYGVYISPDISALQADPGQTVDYTLQVNNIGLNGDSYDLTLDSDWVASAPSTVGPIAAGEYASIDVQVTIPLSATLGQSDTAILTAISQFNSSISDTAQMVTTANYYDLSLTPATSIGEGYPGEPVEYILQLANTGNITDTFDIQSEGSWTVVVSDTIGPVAADANVSLPVTVIVSPSALAGESDISTITATSQADASKTQSSTLTSTALQAGPSVTPPSSHKSGRPGVQVSYTLQVTNHNYITDTFTLTVDTDWGVEYPFTVGPVPAEGTTSVVIKVTVPYDAPGSSSDTAVVTFSSSNPLVPPATATLTTTAIDVYGFRVAPEVDTLTGHGRGTVVDYTLLITNTGNVTDSYNLYLISSVWPVDMPDSIGPVGQGETAHVTVSVHVPIDIEMGATNDVILSVNSVYNGIGHRALLYTHTFWYSTFLPLTERH